MCTVIEEQLAQWEADYEADVTDMYMSDPDRFKRVLAKLGFIYVGPQRAMEKLALDERIKEVRHLMEQPRLRIKEKGPESSDPEPRCGLCEQTYKACRCIPF